jgi:DNA-binding SARP family transcriptional activator
MNNKSQTFNLTLFGGFQLLDSKKHPIALSARKSKALLAWLAVNPDHEHTREKLAGLFWPDSNEKQARHSLRQALADLRKIMPDPQGPLCTTKDWISLNSKMIIIDALVFDQAVSNGDEKSLDYANEIYKGEFLEGCNPHTDMFDEWLAGYRSDYSERAAAMMNQRMLQLIEQSEFDRIIPLAMQLISIDPLQEAAYRALMRAHYELGNYAIALRWYRRCQRVLKIELEVQPDPQTIALYEELLSAKDQREGAIEKHDHDLGSLVNELSYKPQEKLKSLQRSNAKASFNSSQRMIYQAEAAIEGILDQIGGQSFLIRGEQGSGKSQLAREIAELAESQGFFICYGQITVDCTAAKKKSALGFTYKLSCCLDNKINSSDSSVSKAVNKPGCTDKEVQEFDDIATLVKTASEILPILLLVEDLHHADTQTLGLMAKLISAVGNSAALLIMTSCFEGEPLDPVWRGAMRGAPLTTIDLESTSCHLQD